MTHFEPKQPTILVTGGHGLLGSRLVPLLVRKLADHRLIVVKRKEGQRAVESLPIESVSGDLRDETLWARLPTTITHIFHLAALIPWKSEDRWKANVVTDNLLPLANLAEHSQQWPHLRQIIYGSSVSVYAPTSRVLREDSPKQPVDLYGASKLAGEELLSCFESRGVRVVSLRFSSLYGRGQYQGTVLPLMVKRARERQSLRIFGDGSRTQDFLHCEDAARALWLSFQQNARGVFNIGTGTPVTLTQLAETVSKVFSNGESGIEYLPVTTASDPGIKLDIGKARSKLHYEAEIQLEAGLRKLKEEMGA